MYHIQSAYQLLECIEHRKLVHNDDRAILLIYNFVEERYPHYHELEIFGFFDEIYVYPHWRVKFTNPSEVAVNAKKAYETTVPYSINEFDHIYVAGVHVAFTTFLISNKIRFCLFEDGSGALSRPEVLREIEKKDNINKYNIMEFYGLYYPCNFDENIVEKKYCDLKSQTEGFFDALAENFNLLEKFKQLDSKIQEKIFIFFRCPSKVECGKDAILLLSQHFANLQQLSFEEHVYIYQVLFDYIFDSSDVIIKTHPDDIMYYKKLFPRVRVIKEKFPSELLPFIFERRPKTIATITSTGINSIRGEFENVITFEPSFEKNFVHIRRYFTALRICQYFNCKRVKFVDVDHGVVKNLFGKYQIANNEGGEIVIINDSLEREKIMEYKSQKKIIIFLNCEGEYTFFNSLDTDCISNLIPVEITVRKYKKEDNFFCTNEIIYVLVDEERKNKMKNFEMEKDEKHSGNTVLVSKMNEEEIRIKVLEGMLQATEKRLVHYINLAKDGEDRSPK